RPHEHRVADPRSEVDCLRAAGRDPPLRACDPKLAQHAAEPLAVLGEVDRLERRAEDTEARRFEIAGELERRLAAELDHDTLGLLALAHREHAGRVEWLE